MSSNPPARQGRTALLFGVLLVALIANYGLFRGRHLVTRWRSAQASQATLDAKLRAGPPAAEARREALVRVRELEARLSEASARWATPAQQAELAVQVSALAEAEGLLVERLEPAPPEPRRPGAGAAKDRLEDRLTAAPESRALRRWVVRGGFSALWRFLSRLEQLPWSVAVVRLTVERPETVLDPQAPLRIEMTVAL